jgi:hypothetical protein
MVKRQPLLLVATLFLSTAPLMSSNAQSPDVDWKLYGSSSGDMGNERCFYDAAGVQRRPDNMMRVWVKCLSQSEMDQIDIEHDYGGKILNRAAEKTVAMYVPPLATVTDISFDDATGVIASEQVADITFLEPTARIFYELNCQERMLRELSISIRNHGTGNNVRSWTHAAPETNGDRLLKLLCR